MKELIGVKCVTEGTDRPLEDEKSFWKEKQES